MVLDFDFEDIPPTLQSQFSASPIIKKLTEQFEHILPNQDIELFYNEIFNIYTARGVGLDIWGRILGVGREIKVNNINFFGFLGSQLSGFNQAPFVHEVDSDVYIMEDNAYRHYLLLTKAFANISSADAATINYILSRLFGNKACYIIPVGIMQVRFVFEFYLTPFEQAVFNLGLITKAAGVGYEYLQVDKPNTFGFAGSELQPFAQGVFDPYGLISVE